MHIRDLEVSAFEALDQPPALQTPEQGSQEAPDGHRVGFEEGEECLHAQEDRPRRLPLTGKVVTRCWVHGGCHDPLFDPVSL